MEPYQGSAVQKAEDYLLKLPELEAYLVGNWLTDLANFSAFVFHSVPRLNWAGFYLFDGAKLTLGPFVGKPACTEIKVGRGVCGTAFEKGHALLVPDVHEFPGHIACDSASRSELVIPVIVDGVTCGVLDLDSPELARFSEADRVGLTLWLGALTAKVPAATWKKQPWR